MSRPLKRRREDRREAGPPPPSTTLLEILERENGEEKENEVVAYCKALSGLTHCTSCHLRLPSSRLIDLQSNTGAVSVHK